jgi:hypothetical protein
MRVLNLIDGSVVKSGIYGQNSDKTAVSGDFYAVSSGTYPPRASIYVDGSIIAENIGSNGGNALFDFSISEKEVAFAEAALADGLKIWKPDDTKPIRLVV